MTLPTYRDRWNERYELISGGLRDIWRNVECERLVLAPNKLDMERLKALQTADHPGLQPIVDFWLDEAECEIVYDRLDGTPVQQWLHEHENTETEVRRDLVLQYLSIVLYARTAPTPLEVCGLLEHLRMLNAPDLRLQLNGSAHARIVQTDRTLLSEREAMQDVAAFAEQLAVPIPADCGTLTKLRTALKNAQLQ